MGMYNITDCSVELLICTFFVTITFLNRYASSLRTGFWNALRLNKTEFRCKYRDVQVELIIKAFLSLLDRLKSYLRRVRYISVGKQFQ